MYLYKIRNTFPKDRPNRTWLILWEPKYSLDNGTVMHKTTRTQPQGLYLQYPILSDIIGSYKRITAKLWPLGFPKSLLQIQYHD